jgi:hypothetical protein
VIDERIKVDVSTDVRDKTDVINDVTIEEILTKAVPMSLSVI